MLTQIGVLAILGLLANCVIGAGVYLESRREVGCSTLGLGLFGAGGALYLVAFILILMR